MPQPVYKSILRLKVGGGVLHRIGILIAADVALRKGYKVEDMTGWRGSGEEPDLVIVKREKMMNVPKRPWASFRLRLEIIDSHDPVPQWDGGGGYDELIKIHVHGKTLDQILMAAELAIP